MLARKSIQTEYNGVVFKSKSEAIIARALDCNAIEKDGFEYFWEYEPDYFKLDDGYIPDFFINLIRRDYDENNKKKLTSFKIVMEYKPSMPTLSYRKRLYGNFKKILTDKNPINEIICVLAVVSPFDKSKAKSLTCIYSLESKEKKLEFNSIRFEGEEIESKMLPCFMSDRNIEKAKEYRFDLIN